MELEYDKNVWRGLGETFALQWESNGYMKKAVIAQCPDACL